MTVTPMTEPDLPVVCIPYITGKTDILSIPKDTPPHMLARIKRARCQFLRNLLHENARDAYSRPDFKRLMRKEIDDYVKRTLRPSVFKDWDIMLHEVGLLREYFERETTRRTAEYFRHRSNNYYGKKLDFYIRKAKQDAFRRCAETPEGLGSLECAIFGHTRYGL